MLDTRGYEMLIPFFFSFLLVCLLFSLRSLCEAKMQVMEIFIITEPSARKKRFTQIAVC